MNLLHNTQLEQSVLSALIWDTSADFAVTTDGLTPDCFSDSRLQRLYVALRTLYQEGKSVHDPMLIIDAMNHLPGEEGEISIPDFLTMVTQDSGRMEVAENIPHYVSALIDYALRRRVMKHLQDATGCISDLTQPANDTMSMLMRQLTESAVADRSNILSFGDVMTDIQQIVDDNLARRKQRMLRTGLKQLDRYGGLHPSDLVIIAGNASAGKTALAVTIAMNIAAPPQPSLFREGEKSPLMLGRVSLYSMEMTPQQLIARMVARQTGVSANRLMFSRLSDEERRKLAEGKEVMASYDKQIFIDGRGVTSVESISQSIRYLHASHAISVAIIDYLQILGLKRAHGDSREEVVASAARQFKNLAKELDIVVILLSQLNRDTNGSQIPTVARIRDSGEINEAADLTILLYRPQEPGMSYPRPWENVDPANTAMLTVAKDRHGGYGGLSSFIVGFNPALSYFYDIDKLPLKTQSASKSVPW